MKEGLVLKKIEAGIKEGSAFIAQDIARNVETYGISPVIAIDGKLKNLRSKIVDFAKVSALPKLLKTFNYAMEDFCFFESKNTKYGKNKTILTAGLIVCICQKSGKVREYKASAGQSWLKAFKVDLEEKSFQ